MVYRGPEEVACFAANSWFGVDRYGRNRVPEPDGGQRTANGLKVELGDDRAGARWTTAR